MSTFTTTHRIENTDARSLDEIDDKSVDLVVTSPPYPMVEMWDDVFGSLDEGITSALSTGDYSAAFDRMHDELEKVWSELNRVVVEGGVVCINIGDATRSTPDGFRLFPNHARIIETMEEQPFTMLPSIHWQKPTNTPAKFVGSGTLPPNQYVTLETEYILVFRKGGKPDSDILSRRHESSYFWEERNIWFSDKWDIQGTDQTLPTQSNRNRSAAYPFVIPYRLINMYSTYGDTILDPFVGTGTTTITSAASGRNSIGCEIDPSVYDLSEIHSTIPEINAQFVSNRFDRHESFVADRVDDGKEFQYESDNYGFPVMTQPEVEMRFYDAEPTIQQREIETTHTPIKSSEIATPTSQQNKTLDSFS